jgi:hypothetical protein
MMVVSLEASTPVRRPRSRITWSKASCTHADDRHVESVTIDLRHPANRTLRDAPLADDAVDAGNHLGAVRKRDGQGVEMLEVAKAEVHPEDRLTCPPAPGRYRSSRSA